MTQLSRRPRQWWVGAETRSGKVVWELAMVLADNLVWVPFLPLPIWQARSLNGEVALVCKCAPPIFTSSRSSGQNVEKVHVLDAIITMRRHHVSMISAV